MNIQTLLGLTENYQADLVDLMLSDKTDGKIKRIFLLGFIKRFYEERLKQQRYSKACK